MKSRIHALFLATCALLTADRAAAESAVPPTPGQAKPAPVFKPKNRGAPIVRVGGGTRGPGYAGPELHVLAPEQSGYTTREQPVLYWYVSRPVRAKIEIAVADPRSVLLKTNTAGVARSGIQTLNLAEHGVRLQPATQYRWSVSVVNDPAQRSGDLFASGGIEYSPPPAIFQAKLTPSLGDRDRAYVYAEEGFWYDAFDAAQRWVREAPANPIAVRVRASLLEQAGLPALAGEGHLAAEPR